MKRNSFSFLFVMAALAVAPFCATAQTAFHQPMVSKAATDAVSDETLRSIATKTTDPELLLGLAYLAKVGSPARAEISTLAIKIKPEYSPTLATLAVVLDGPNETNVAALIQHDPANALGHYLRAGLMAHADKVAETLDAFRAASQCSEIRLYSDQTYRGLIKALDALKLTGRDRLEALSWTEVRISNFSILCLQLSNELSWAAKDADLNRRKEISDLALVLAGHLHAVSFHDRAFGRQALLMAYRTKAEIAAEEKSPQMNGYVTVAQALLSTTARLPISVVDLAGVAEFLPGRVGWALRVLDPASRSKALYEDKVDPAQDDKGAYEQAKADAIRAANELVELALSDPDTVIGAYLKGYLPPPPAQTGPWKSQFTYVEKLMMDKPQLFHALVRYEKAMRGLSAVIHPAYEANEKPVGEIAQRAACIQHLKQIDGATQQWALEHRKKALDSAKIQDAAKYLKGGLVPKCPAGGTYSTSTVSASPTCTIPGHKL